MAGLDAAAFDGKAALVTGAGKRLGYGFAKGLIERGVRTVIHYNSSRGGADELLDLAKEKGVPAAAIQADLADAEQTDRLWEQSVEAIGPIDWLINNASIFDDIDGYEATVEDWDRNMAINARAPYQLTQALARHCRDRGCDTSETEQANHGAVVNLLDYRATRPNDDHYPYTISKSALWSLTVAGAQAYGKHLRVNALALGNILPPADGSPSGQPTFKRTPIKRRGSVEEVVESALWLLTGPGFITGDVIYITGGRHLT